VGDVLLPGVVCTTGIGLAFVPATIAAVAGVERSDAGLAGGLVNTARQVGGSLGLAVLVAVFGTASGHATGRHALTHGMGAAFGFAALLDVGSLLVILALIRTGRLRPAPAPVPRQQEEPVAS
jgi:hypothetical protein